MNALWQGSARALYATVLRAATPLYLLRLWRRGAREPGYRQALGERLGLYRGAVPAPGLVWVHAVSLGETRAAAPLIGALRELQPGLRLLLTHGTATGRHAGLALLQPGDHQAWLPYDTPGAAQRFLRRFQPAVGVLMETELWPSLMREAERARVPVVLANARLSERSARKGRRLAALMHPAARRLSLALAQTPPDAERLLAAGTPQVLISGNLKFDMTPSPAQLTLGRQWRAGLNRSVVMAACTREGEEVPLLAAWRSLPEPRPLLLIVPRHPQRFDEVASLVRAAGLSLARRSSWSGTPPPEALPADVWLGDSMREMALYYATARAALLGGSFEPLGGQNLIEAAACACPVVMGPHTFNFAEAAELSLAAGAALRAATMDDAIEQATRLVADTPRCERASADAARFAAQHQGAAQRMARRIAGLMPTA